MRTLTMTVAAACLACSFALAQAEETPRPAPPAASADAELSRAPVDWHEAIEALKQGSGAVAFFLALIFLCATGWGFLAFVLAVSPNLTERVVKALHASRLKCFLIGAGGFVFLASLVAVSHNKLAVVVLPVLLVATAWGLCGVSEDVGRRAWMLTTRDPGRFARLSLGWPVFFFASWMPVVGWFVVFPIFAFSGLGAFFIALFSGGAAKVQPRTIP